MILTNMQNKDQRTITSVLTQGFIKKIDFCTTMFIIQVYYAGEDIYLIGT